MLDPHKAHEEIKQYENPRYQAELLKRLERLPPALNTLGQLVVQAGWSWLRREKEGGASYNWSAQAFEEMLDGLARLNPGELELLVGAIFPGVSAHVLRAWKMFDQLPYQVGYSRKAFRSPSRPLLLARGAWLRDLARAVRGYDREAAWFAAWTPYLANYYAPRTLGYLFAAAIDGGGAEGEAVYQVLAQSAAGEHPVGAMGRHVVTGLLCSSRREGWDLIERMLLAAQREEGLRQVILESLDESHPQALPRLLRVVVEQNLARFSSALRAFDVWFGLALEASPLRQVELLLREALEYLENPATRTAAIDGGSPQGVYLGLWCTAFEDAPAALPGLRRRLGDPDPAVRFACIHLLVQMRLEDTYTMLLAAIDDPDARLAAYAALRLAAPDGMGNLPEHSDLFERLERLIPRIPVTKTVWKSPLWEWLEFPVERAAFAAMLLPALGSRPLTRLAAYKILLDADARYRLAYHLGRQASLDETGLDLLLEFAGDASSHVRGAALDALGKTTLAVEDTRRLEGLLVRKAADLRRGVLTVLLKQPDEAMLASARRLLESRNEQQRKAGLELLRECQLQKRSPARARRLAAEYEPEGEAEVRHKDEVLEADPQSYTLDNALGLMDPARRTPAVAPPQRSLFGRFKNEVVLGTPAAQAVLVALDGLAHERRSEEIRYLRNYDNQEQTGLLGEMRWSFPQVDPAASREANLARLPLAETWESWLQNRPAEQRDPDGLELVRALALTHLYHFNYGYGVEPVAAPVRLFAKYLDVHLTAKLRYHQVVSGILDWLVYLNPAEAEAGFAVTAAETSLARISGNELTGETSAHGDAELRMRKLSHHCLAYVQVARRLRAMRPEEWTSEEHTRLWRLVRWLDQPKPGLERQFPMVEDALYGYEAGAATRDDLFDLFLGPRRVKQQHYYPTWGEFGFLHTYTTRKLNPILARFPVLGEVVDACRERIVEIEVRRGDLPTAASGPALAIRSLPGMAALFKLLRALEKDSFERGYLLGTGRTAVLSHLVHVSHPLESDTPEAFAVEAHRAGVKPQRLVELAVYAPFWAGHVEHTLGWPGLAEAVWWVYAHTKDRQWSVEKELREAWTARVSEYTPLDSDSLLDGAVDVGWFQRVYELLGDKRWQAVLKAALYASSGTGHARAVLYANGMLGRTPVEEMTRRIREKRHQDSVRALGLAPLPGGEERAGEILSRYEILQEFRAGSKKFGAQRQASEKLAVSIGMENLARTAGYADPLRLEWAMEVQSLGDLEHGAVTVEAGEVSVSLRVDELGEAQLEVLKKGKPLKAVPAAVKKDLRVAELLLRKAHLEKQARRMRFSLEQAMCRGDAFNAAELGQLFRHPLLRVMIEQLVFRGGGGAPYPVEGGAALQDHSGGRIPLQPGDGLRIAHPLDLLQGGAWHLWQRECFSTERIQPFKQIFRELYLPTEGEKGDHNTSLRYAGQQVNPRQALALLGGRGWVASYEEGVHRTFHDAGLTARVEFQQGYFTPAEVENLTVDSVHFTRRGDWTSLPLDDIPGRLFSEVMRDLDLVVSVAHAGGVDPETSLSSIESRAALVRETSALLGLGNVTLKNRHVLVEGRLGSYSIHLGSAQVQRLPGGSVCIIPVHSQHRGRLFLPFVDSDPRSAEVVSKVVLLARDDQIKDPTILEQLLR